MEIQDIKNSGDLEAYVCGALSRQESIAIAKLIKQHPELEQEVELIENAYFTIAAGLAPAIDGIILHDRIKEYIKESKADGERNHWSQYLGWAAALLLFLGGAYLFNENTSLNETIVSVEQKNQILDSEVENLDSLNSDYQEALAFIKEPNTIKVNLPGQGDYSSSRAVAFYNPESDVTYLDTSGLPEAPENMTYQLWSLTLNPLAPTSLGVVSVTDKTLIKFQNTYETQAFGITLEDAGGSLTPTLERLYTLGVIE